jgi:hypothetical protein
MAPPNNRRWGRDACRFLAVTRGAPNIGSNDRGAASSLGQGGGGYDWDKSASLVVGANPRRSTSSLAVIRASALYLAN